MDLREPEWYRKWVALNAFNARVTVHGLMDLKYMAIWTLRAALEDDHLGDSSGQTVAGEGQVQEVKSTHDINVSVVTALQWIRHAGHLIYHSQERLGLMGQGGRRWNGQRGFSRERWDFWKSRFRFFQEQVDVSRETRIAATVAVKTMEKIEGGWQPVGV